MASICTHPYMAAHLSCPTESSSLQRVLTSFVLPVHNQSARLVIHQGLALRRKFLPATSSFFVLSLLIYHSDYSIFRRTLPVIIMVVLYYSFTQPLAALPDVGCLPTSLMHQLHNRIVKAIESLHRV